MIDPAELRPRDENAWLQSDEARRLILFEGGACRVQERHDHATRYRQNSRWPGGSRIAREADSADR
jgi:hypothetical protein